MNFEAAYIDGRAVSSESLKGVNVLYVFGHSTCTPCIAIGRIMKTLKDEKKYAESDLRFVFLTDDGKEGQDILVQRYGIDPAMMVYLPEDKYEEVGIIGPMRPVTLLVDRDGKVVFKIAGGPDPRDPAVALGQFNKTITPEIEKLLTSQRK